MAISLNLTCPTCGSSETPRWRPEFTWASSHGYWESVYWSATGHLHPIQLLEAPQLNHRYSLLVSHPFTASPQAWVMFQPEGDLARADDPAHPFLNSCWVCIELLEIIEPTEKRSPRETRGTWITAIVRNCIPIGQLIETYPCDRTGPAITDYFQSLLKYDSYRTELPGWSLIGASCQGDVGAMALCHHTPNGPILVAYQESSFHEDQTYIGHRPLTPQEWQQLDQIEITDP